MKIYDKRPVIVTNGPSAIPSKEAVATALGISPDDVILFTDVSDNVRMAFAYLPYKWKVTSYMDSDGGVSFVNGNSFSPKVGQEIPVSLITKIEFYGSMPT